MNEYSFEDLYLGLSASFKVKVTLDMIDTFISISGDLNPLHSSVSYALSNNMKDRVVHGLLTSGFYSRLVGVHLPGVKCLLQGINITFKKPVYPNENLIIYGEVSYLNEAYHVAEIKACITNDNGEKISTAKIKVGLLK